MSAVIGIIGIAFSLYFVFTHHPEGFPGYFDVASLVLLAICPPSVMLLSRTMGDFAEGVRLLLQSWFSNKRNIQSEVIDTLTRCSARVRAEGFGSLVAERKNLRYDLLRDGISMIVNDFSADEIKHNLQNKISAKQSKMQNATDFFMNLAKTSPSVGMLGTLIGLITMMSKMKDPTAMGSGMALAMIGTLYGLILSMLIYGPLGEKILVESEKSLEIDMLVLEGIMALKNKKSSLHLRDIMSTYGKNAPATQPKGA